ncbi:hypothetical protein ACG94X_12890 [Acinetobacter sp. ULE_I010]|uniref:hypothetical protein n=1 Tax=Acinetobacter sp. ULE_I010 TaxID=3373065 RepID=UPI003AF7F11A
MALDPIWKQQLTLVTYGNEYLTQNLSFTRWVNHAIFNQHAFNFRDLIRQHLLAQHFQVWLEGIKKQGTTRLTLHSSSVLNDEKNPNANVELLPITHFIVSHEQNKKTAWIFGKELAEWYTADNDYEAPKTQCSPIRQEIFWRFDLNSKYFKRIDQDLVQPNWDDIQAFTENELFDTQFAQGFQEPNNKSLPYYGIRAADQLLDDGSLKLSLLPTDYQADYAHETLNRLDALSQFLEDKIQHPYDENEQTLSPDVQMNLRHFSQKLDDLTAKFVTKVANHYKSARLTPKEIVSPFEPQVNESRSAFSAKPQTEHKYAKTSVFTLIFITLLICLAAYYFGL